MDRTLIAIRERVIEYPPDHHLRVLGPPASGKSTLLLERFRALRSRGHRPLIVTYSRESADRLRTALLSRGTWLASYPPVVTYFELAAKTIAHSRAPTVLSDIEEQAVIDTLVRRHRADLKSIYANMVGTKRLVSGLLDTFHFLMQNGVGVSGRGRRRPIAFPRRDPGGSKECADVVLLYERYIEFLSEHGLATYYDIWYNAVPALEEDSRRDPFPQSDIFLVEDFHDVDPGQFALLSRLAPPEGGRALEVFGDPTGARFRHRGTSERFLMEVFPTMYGGETVEIPLAESGKSGALARSIMDRLPRCRSDRFVGIVERAEDGGILPGEGDQSMSGGKASGKQVEVRIVRTRDELAEVNFAAASIEALLVDGSVRPEEIAVVARDKNRYAPLLSFVFTQYGIPLDTGSARIGASWSLMFSLLELYLDGEDARARSRLESSPLFSALVRLAAERAGIGPGETADGERGWKLVCDLLDDVSSGRDDPLEEIATKIVIPLEIEDRHSASPVELEVAALIGGWRKLSTLAKRVGVEVDLRGFMEASGYGGVGNRTPAPSPGCVGFYSCHETHNRFFPVVFLLGCSETLFPALPERDELVPHRELERLAREATGDGGVSSPKAASAEEHLAGEMGLMLHAFKRATERLVITAPREFFGEELPAPSAPISEAIGEEGIEEGGSDCSPPAVPLSFTILSPEAGEEVASVLSSHSPLVSFYRSEQLVARSFAIDRFPLSQSSLGSYSTCPRRFFYEKALGIERPETVAGRVGILFHELIKRFSAGRRTRVDLTSEASEEIDRLIEEVLSESYGERDNLETRLMARRLRALSDGMRALEQAREDEYEIELLEETLSFERAGYTFSCRLDRVERLADGRLLVVDYKTGGLDRKADTLRKKSLGREVKPEKRNWQVPIALRAVMALEERTPAGFFFYSLKKTDDPRGLRIEVVGEGSGPRGEKNKFRSYLTESELERCIDDAAKLASEIFAERESFEKVEDEGTCWGCSFKRICRR